jgi:hypothetical protein
MSTFLRVAMEALNVHPKTTAIAAGTIKEERCPSFRMKLRTTKARAAIMPSKVVGSMRIAPNFAEITKRRSNSSFLTKDPRIPASGKAQIENAAVTQQLSRY